MKGTITEAQESYLRMLITDRVSEPILAKFGLPTNEMPDLCYLMKGQASQLISALKDAPKRVAEVAPTTQLPSRSVTTIATRQVPHGTYTIDMGDGSHVTLQLAPASFVKDRKTTVVSYLSGQDNELAYTGFAFVEQDRRVVVWRKFREGYGRQQAAVQLLLTGDVDEAHKLFLDQAEAYALQSGCCMRCGKTLTVPASIHRGLGPICAGKEEAASVALADWDAQHPALLDLRSDGHAVRTEHPSESNNDNPHNGNTQGALPF